MALSLYYFLQRKRERDSSSVRERARISDSALYEPAACCDPLYCYTYMSYLAAAVRISASSYYGALSSRVRMCVCAYIEFTESGLFHARSLEGDYIYTARSLFLSYSLRQRLYAQLIFFFSAEFTSPACRLYRFRSPDRFPLPNDPRAYFSSSICAELSFSVCIIKGITFAFLCSQS